jgi:AraC-like DNA-binding protein
VSCLAHTFKEQMNISIHQFILKKRLVMAHHKILAGEPATKAAMECGFNDYSGFYKQYKKLFGKNPSCREPVGF